jgi:hypothetical protein
MVAAAIAILPLAAAASDQDDALRLAARAASPAGMESVSVVLHGLPKGLPSPIPLPNATLLGSIARAPRTRSVAASGSVGVTISLGGSMVLYYDAPNRVGTVNAYEDALRLAGWRRVDLTRQIPFQRGGFAASTPRFDFWCSSVAQPVVINLNTPDADATAIDVGVSAAGEGSSNLCTAEQPFSFERFFRPSPMPTFAAVAGIEISGTSQNGDGSTTGARITTSLGLPAAFESFAKQLRDAGWTPKAATSASGLQSQTFTKSVDGTPYVALLTVYALDATHYVALADVSNLTA